MLQRLGGRIKKIVNLNREWANSGRSGAIAITMDVTIDHLF